MNCEVRIHKGYAEFKLLQQEGISRTQLFGEYQFIFSSKKGKISMIQLVNYFKEGDSFWEIYCLEGNLFEYPERFDTRQDAEQKIRGFLG